MRYIQQFVQKGIIMKKFYMALLTGLTTVAVLAGCGKKEEDMAYIKDFDPLDYVELGEYKGLEVSMDATEVTEEELNDYIDYLLTYYMETVEITERDEVQSGDIVNIDYMGKKDGVAFDGGTAEGYDLTIGSGTFIPGFEDALIGMKVGETRDIDLTFPENYPTEDLAGAPVVFTVTVNSIKEEVLPELTDELVVKMGDEGITTVEQFKDDVRQTLEEQKETEQQDLVYGELQQMALDGCTFKSAPSGFIDRLYNTLIESLTDMGNNYGMDVGVVASYYYGVSADNYEAELRDYCENTLAHQYIMMSAIAKKEGIDVTDKDVDADIAEMLTSYGGTQTVEEYKEMIGDVEAYREYLVVNKVLQFLLENAVITK